MQAQTLILLLLSFFSRDIAKAQAIAARIHTGFVIVNDLIVPTADPRMPFGGVKATGNGHREGGWEVYDFYTETKTVYVDYSGTLQKAQIDNVED